MTEPKRPSQVSQYAQACLEALSANQCGQWLSLGGAFGLAHYLEYRATHDVDAWWVEPVSREERQRIVGVLQAALQPFGQVRTREWGDVVSVELLNQGRAAFSFQIARRSAQLQEPMAGLWPGGIRVDAFADLVASKMTALVERGAPRDFRDIYMLCQSHQADPGRCWNLWQKRERLSGGDPRLRRASLAIRTHLARIEQARPLARIADAKQRAEAEGLRTWFATEFLHEAAD